MRLTQVVEVDDARVDALTPEAFALVLEARGWKHPWRDEDVWVGHGCILLSEGAPRALNTLANAHHACGTFDALVEVERVQALLDAVGAAELGDWIACGSALNRANTAAGLVAYSADASIADCGDGVGVYGIRSHGPHLAERLRAQLPRLVRTVCGLEGAA